MLMILRCVCPAQASLWNSRLIYSTIQWHLHLDMWQPAQTYIQRWIPKHLHKILFDSHPPVSVDSSFILWISPAQNVGVILDSSHCYSPLIQTINNFLWPSLWNISRTWPRLTTCFHRDSSHQLLSPGLLQQSPERSSHLLLQGLFSTQQLRCWFPNKTQITSLLYLKSSSISQNPHQGPLPSIFHYHFHLRALALSLPSPWNALGYPLSKSPHFL